MMQLFEWIKILITIFVIIFCSVISIPSLLWIASCFVFSFLYFLYIPAQQRYTLFMIVPIIITIAIMQLVTGFAIARLDITIIIITSYKIACITVIIIGSRSFIGQNGLKAFINILPHNLKLFFLIFIRILYTLLKLNRMIVFQIQSRIDSKSKKRYYIPKYYAVAFISNQFYSLSYYRNGILLRSIDTIPDIIIQDSHSKFEYVASGIIIFVLITNYFLKLRCIP